MKFTKCYDLDPSKMDRFSEYMKSHPGVFNVAIQKCIVYSHDDIFHLTFEKTRLSLVEPRGCFAHFTKIKCISTKKTNLLRVYDSEDIDAYVLQVDGEKFDLGSREKYWNEIIKSGNLAVKQDYIVYPTN
ncbi:unnamed protein product [Caenorhabditis brenneri]